VSNTGLFARDFGLRDQLRRSAVSIASNISEGFERDGNKEFRQFLFIAKGSVGEVSTQLYVALDVGYISEEKFFEMKNQADEIGRMLGGLLKYLSSCEIKGIKYKG